VVTANFDGVTADVVLERLINSHHEKIRYLLSQIGLTTVPKQNTRFGVLWDGLSPVISTA
jgi:hypothetical protein